VADEAEFPEDLKQDIDASRRTNRWREKGATVKEIFHQLEWNVIDGKSDQTEALIHAALDAAEGGRTLISGPLAVGISEVGRRFKNDEYFLPEVMVSTECMNVALAILKPLIVSEKGENIGTVVIGTVHGDIHDIGKKIVAMILEAAGFTLLDLGVNVSPEQFIAAIREHDADIIGMSALLTTTMTMQGEIIKAIVAEGLREQVKILVGGAPTSQAWAEQIGADAYCADAMVAVDKAKACVRQFANLHGSAPELAEGLLAIA
jgi:5-methyltetrahydrofolate--homocysteine methyltransferase